MIKNSVETTTMKRSTKRMLFYISVVALPILQFLIFYVYQNINTFLIAFRKQNMASGVLVSSFAGFENFSKAFKIFFDSGYMVVNSIKLFLYGTLIIIPLAMIFSFFIYKKYLLSEFFRVMLFIPTIVSGVVLVLLFRYIVTDVYIEINKVFFGKTVFGLLNKKETKYGVVLFFYIWCSFGANVLLFTGAMSGVDESLIEAAQLDGANIFKEFIHIIFPSIYPTFVTFVIMQITTIFAGQMNLFTFFGSNAGSLSTIGYYVFMQSAYGIQRSVADNVFIGYPVLAAFGLLITVIVIPLVLISRKLFDRFGPSDD